MTIYKFYLTNGKWILFVARNIADAKRACKRATHLGIDGHEINPEVPEGMHVLSAYVF